MIMMVLGKGLMTLGRSGLAGSGLLLEPEMARKDLEPWNRATGGMVKDAFDGAGVDLEKISDKLAGDALPFDEKLRRLHALHQDGILTDKEYQEQKQRLLESN
jgi:hypothetical protein